MSIEKMFNALELVAGRGSELRLLQRRVTDLETQCRRLHEENVTLRATNSDPSVLQRTQQRVANLRAALGDLLAVVNENKRESRTHLEQMRIRTATAVLDDDALE